MKRINLVIILLSSILFILTSCSESSKRKMRLRKLDYSSVTGTSTLSPFTEVRYVDTMYHIGDTVESVGSNDHFNWLIIN